MGYAIAVCRGETGKESEGGREVTAQQRYDEQKRILRDATISDREALARIRLFAASAKAAKKAKPEAGAK